MMKAISVKQPWADHIMYGKKTIEIRTWKTHYRGDILICASKNPKTERSGVALCIAELYDIKSSVKSDEEFALCEIHESSDYSWYLRNIRELRWFPPVKGKLSIYDIEIPSSCVISYTNLVV